MSKFVVEIELKKDFSDESFKVTIQGNSKFGDDCIYVDQENYFLLLDGAVLNKSDLLMSSKNWRSCIVDLYQQKGDAFFDLLKGSYVGLLFDKNAGKWLIYSDHIGSKPIYYHYNNDKIYISNNYTELVNTLMANSISISLNVDAAYLLLTYGFVFEDITILNEVSRLMVGHYGIISKNGFTTKEFFKLNNDPIQITEEEAVEEIDKRFRNAVKLAFEKDREYGLKHLVSLSGGLDSRMTSWVAHEMGYTDQLNITFSQSDYLDESIPKKIAEDLKHEWLFKALDNGTFLNSIDEINKISGGNVLYYGLAHSYSLYKYMDFSDLGLLHTGQLGDVVIGSYSSEPSYSHEFSKLSGAYSNTLKKEFGDITFSEYRNEELFKMNIRGFYGINMGLLPVQEFTETYSPFYDKDFMSFALSVPIKMRYDHRLYKKWIIKKYPEAANYVWESTKAKITDWHIKLVQKEVPVQQLLQKILRRLGINKCSKKTKNHMNPLDYWYTKNVELKRFQDEYFEANINRLNDYPELKEDCIQLYKEGNGVEKNQVLTLISTTKQFF
ncbi:asparagine synthase-related protein [Fodinibius sp. SL11]|uniref:asparagine synthase-related protein n=1 Tax=Fodinibius sp. SL11 TaxID=3425690 RepID=UPI003F88441E